LTFNFVKINPFQVENLPSTFFENRPTPVGPPAQLINGWWTNYWVLPTRWCNMSHFKCEHARNWKFF